MSPRTVLLASLVLLLALVVACGDGDDDGNGGDSSTLPGEWPTFAANLDRTGYNADEAIITKENVDRLVLKWQFPTGGPVAASPAVATVDLPDEGPARLVVVGSYDGNVYAIRAEDGSEVWSFAVKEHPGVSYGAIASSATIATVDGDQRVYVAGGETMYALDATNGELLWEFDAGTGCTDCDARTERNEVLSSPAVLPGRDLVLFGMDVNDSDPGKGGFYALSAGDGRLRWYFDVETGATCTTDGDDDIRRFDGYHSTVDLGLPDDFFGTRDGCDFDRTETGCGNVWSPVSVDLERKLLYFSTSNCDTDDDPATAEPAPPMPLYDEAIVALDLDGTPAWTWRPREVDNDDLAFGAAPNLFSTTVDGEEREVVGVGGKDGTYYLLDRDGENELTGEIEPYWQRNVVDGGSIGGLLGTAAVGEGRVFFGTGIGESVEEFQTPSAWALDAASGEIAWTQEDAAPFFGSTSAVPGVVFMGGVDAQVRAFDADTGEILASLPQGGIVFSQTVVAAGQLYIGSGFGAEGVGSGEAAERAQVPASIAAYCVEGVDGCTALDDVASATGEALYSPQDNQLDVYDLETGEVTVLIAAEDNMVNGQVCLLPDGSGNFLLGEDTGQGEGERQGWGIFSPDAELVGKLLEPETPGEAEQLEPFGCAFDGTGRLFVTDTGSGTFDAEDGKLIVFLPPEYEEACVLDTTLRTAGNVAVDDVGNVYVPEAVPPGRVLQFAPPFPTSSDDCDSIAVSRSTFIEDPEMGTPIGIARAPNGNWYISSVLIPATIREYDRDGNFVRVILEPDTAGNPSGIAVDSQGTIYYADLALVSDPERGFGPEDGSGTVRRITFAEDGTPNAPEIMGDGLSFPDAVSVLPVP